MKCLLLCLRNTKTKPATSSGTVPADVRTRACLVMPEILANGLDERVLLANSQSIARADQWLRCLTKQELLLCYA